MPNIPRLIPWIKSPLGPKLPICPICNERVELESSKTDEYGKAIHEECYLIKLHAERAA
jgi:hypothetical protein